MHPLHTRACKPLLLFLIANKTHPITAGIYSPYLFLPTAHLVTGALGHRVRLAVVLGHVRVHEVHDVRPDGHREDGREGGGLLGHTLLGEDGHYGASRHGWVGGGVEKG